MPRYYFDIDDEPSPDNVGVDLANTADAYGEATRLISDLMKDHSQLLRSRGQWNLTVTDDSHLGLFQISVRITDPLKTS